MPLKVVLLTALALAYFAGVGYAVWYAALQSQSATRAAVLQLLVPILAAAGAIAWLGESVSPRFILAGSAILGGVALTVVGRVRTRAGARRS